jgi:DNA-binding transcriptional ArsR family regulator
VNARRIGPLVPVESFGAGPSDELASYLALWLDSDMTDEQTGVFRALADPTRRQILQDLREGELSAGEIVARFKISGPSISRHLTVLKAAGLVTERREANRVYYSLVAERLAVSVGNFLSVVCPEQVVLRHKRGKTTRTRAEQ